MFLFAGSAKASDVSLNLGYQNAYRPDTIGINLMHSWTNFAYEFGFKLMDANGDRDFAEELVGAVSLKYIFANSAMTPYVQFGYTFDLYAKGDDDKKELKLEFHDWYAGLGFMVGRLSGVYGFGSFNFYNGSDKGTLFAQVGVGAKIF
jgi:hypothetical protein